MTSPVLLTVNLRSDATEGVMPLRVARRMGLRTILFGDKQYALEPGLVEQQWIAPTYDIEAALACFDGYLAESGLTIAGVVTWGDRDVELTARIAEKLGVRGLPPATARAARNKYVMRATLSEEPDLCPAFRRVRTPEDLEEGLRAMPFPLVLKPAGASGSLGIFLLHDRRDAERAYLKIKEVCAPERDPMYGYYPHEYILEEYLAGPEFSVEGLVHDGQVWIAAVTDKWTTNPFFLEYQHVLPTAQPPEIEAQIRATAKRAARRLGLRDCAFHIECKLTPRGVYIIECAGRPGGGTIASHLVKLATGLDFHEQVIRNALGMEIVWTPDHVQFAGIRKLHVMREGVLAAVSWGSETLGTGIVHRALWVGPGARIVQPPEDFDLPMLGYVVAVGATHDEVQARLATEIERARVEWA